MEQGSWDSQRHRGWLRYDLGVLGKVAEGTRGGGRSSLWIYLVVLGG